MMNRMEIMLHWVAPASHSRCPHLEHPLFLSSMCKRIKYKPQLTCLLGYSNCIILIELIRRNKKFQTKAKYKLL